MKHRFKNRMTENLGLKIMAFFFAALLWLVVVNIDDPVDTQIYRNIPVNVTNEELISSGGKTYQIVNETETVNVTVKAKRSVLAKIKADDIVATADFKDMELVSLVPITASVTGHETDIESASANPHNLQVKVEDIAKNSFPLTVNTTGTLRDGYVLGEMKTNPESITIGGSESLVNSIDKAVARINISGMSESATMTADLVLYDAEGNVIDQTLLSNNLGEKGLSVDIEVLGTKDLPIITDVSGQPGDGYYYNGMTIEPQSIKVYGTSSDLSDISEIEIPASALDITDLKDKKEFVIDIRDYLPEGLELADDKNNSIMVTVLIEARGTKTIEFPVESISVSNLAEGLKLEYASTDTLKLQFQGEQSLLDKLDVKNAVFMDVKEYTEAGDYQVPVTVECPTGITLVGEPIANIKISNKE